MKSDILSYNIDTLKFQRNGLVVITMGLLLSLLIALFMLMMKQDRVVVVPPFVEKEFWVDAKNVSPTYLEQYGLFLSQLILEKSPQSAAKQREMVLRHTDPSFAGSLRKRLVEEEEILKKQNTSYVFYPVDVRVDIKKMEVLLVGDRVVYVSHNPVATEREEYMMGFSFSGSRLLLTSLVKAR